MKAPITLFVMALCALPLGCTKDAEATGDGECTSCASCAGDADAGEHVASHDDAGHGDHAGGQCSDCADAGVVEATPTPGAGKGFTLTEVTPISKILASPADFEGKRVLVKGDAVGVCAKAGCWARLKSDEDNSKSLFVKVMDGEIVFPMEAMGHEITAEGILQKIVTPVEKLREIYAARAAEKGEEFDPSTVTAPRISWQLRGLGARWEI
ncbi:MAG: DUF4920 domain-containing protein [bacterium]|nr:DUF4920 domain-containing protein [bacterium]